MDHTVTALERAFQLASSGDCATVSVIKKQLIQEGYSVAQITGRMLSKQLLALIRAAQGKDQQASAGSAPPGAGVAGRPVAD